MGMWNKKTALPVQASNPNPTLLLLILSSMRSAALKGSGSIKKQPPTRSSRPETANLVTSSEPVMFGGCPKWVAIPEEWIKSHRFPVTPVRPAQWLRAQVNPP